MKNLYYLFIYIYIILAVISYEFVLSAVEDSRKYSILVGRNQAQAIHLKSQYDLSSGTVLNLPIDIDEQKITINGTSIPKLKSINSPNEASNYYFGDQIYVELEYYSPVLVTGSPSLTLNTGCNSISCVTPEIQSFTCAAERGYFSMRLENQFIMNINVNTTKEMLASKIIQLNGIEEVTVSISAQYPGLEYNSFDLSKVCSTKGNLVQIIFNRTNFPQSNGNIPPFYLNRLNNDGDLRSGFSQGIADQFLTGFYYDYKVNLSNQTTEVVQGKNMSDALASYYSGNGTNIITFLYTINTGDEVEALNVKSINFQNGSITSFSGYNVSTSVPVYGIGPRYMTSSASSLSYNSKISIESINPKVLYVTSPNISATYTAGDRLFIDVVFNLEIEISNTDQIFLQLSTGIFSREMPYYDLLDGNIVRFVYVVKLQDISSSLEYTSSDAFRLYNNASIYRVTGDTVVFANTTLPEPGTINSLSYYRTLIIDTTSPVVITLTTTSPQGNYTGGDLIQFDMAFNTKIYVNGTPRFAIRNTPRDLNVVIRTAPCLPSFTYERSFPDGIAQVLLTFYVNWQISLLDIIRVDLPQLYFRDDDDPNIRIVSVSSSFENANLFSGYFNNTEKQLILVSNQTIPAFTSLELLIEGKTGLFISPEGSIALKSGIVFESVLIPNHLGQFVISDVESVGLQGISLSFTPPSFDKSVPLIMSLNVPEYLSINDTFILKMPDFEFSDANSLSGYFYYNNSAILYQWLPLVSELHLTIVIDIKDKSFYLNFTDIIEFFLPQQGINSQSVFLTMSSKKNGDISYLPIQNITKVCAAYVNESTSIFYKEKNPGKESDVLFTWNSGASGYVIGDIITFSINASTSLMLGLIDVNYYLNSNFPDSFEIYLYANKISFIVTQPIPSFSFVSVSIDSTVNILVPFHGISSKNDKFSFYVQSSNCQMKSPRYISYSKNSEIFSIIDGQVSYSPINNQAVFGALTNINITLQLSYNHSFIIGDLLYITLDGFTKSYEQSFDQNNVTSLAPLIVRFDHAFHRLEIEFLGNFTNSTLNIFIDSAAGIYLPTTGSILSNSFKLSVYSPEFGKILNGYVLSSTCMGFCEKSLMLSKYLTSIPTSIILSFNYKLSLLEASNLVVIINGIASLNSGLYQYRLVVTDQLIDFSGIGTLLNNRFNITLPSTIQSLNTIELYIEEIIFYSSETSNQDMSIEYVDNRYNGTTVTDFTLPLIYKYPLFDNASVYIHYSSISGERKYIDLIFTLPNDQDLTSNELVYISLQGLDYDSSLAPSLRNALVNITGRIDYLKSAYDDVDKLLILRLLDTMPAGNELHFRLYAWSSSNSSYNLTYSIGLGENQAYQSLYHPFDVISESPQIFYSSLKLYFKPNSIHELEYLELKTSLSTNITLGQKINLILPILSSYNTSQLLINMLGLSPPTLVASAHWFGSNSSLEITFLGLILPRNNIHCFINISQGVLSIPNTAISSSTQHSYIQYRDSAGYLLSNASLSLPIIGSSAKLTVDVLNPGRNTQYNLSVEFFYFPLYSGSIMNISLPGFSRKISSFPTSQLSCLGNGNYSLVFNSTWYSRDSILSMNFVDNSSLILSNLLCVVPYSYQLITPSFGIRLTESFYFNLTYSLPNNQGYQTYTNQIVQISNIGGVISSGLIISPQSSNSAVELTFSLTLEDNIQTGDIIHLYLPSFFVPTRPFPYSSNLGNSVTIKGVSSYHIKRLNIDGSVYYDEMISYLSIEFRSNITSKTSMEWTIYGTSGIISPTSGLYSGSYPWFSIISTTSPIAGVTVANFTKIGSLSPSSFNFVSDDNTLMNIGINLTTTCALLSGDSISISTPQFLSPNSQVINASFIYFSSSRYTANFTIQWKNSTKEILISLNDGLLSSNSKVFFNISFPELFVNKLVFYENDTRLTYSLNSTTCPVKNEVFDISSSSYLLSTRLELYPDINPDLFSLRFSLVPSIGLLSDDVITLILSDVSFDSCSGSCLIPFTGNFYGFGSNATIYTDPLGQNVNISLRLKQNVSAYQPITFQTSSQSSYLLSNLGFANGYSDVKIVLYRSNQLIFYGDIFNITDIPLLTDSQIIFSNPLRGEPTGIQIVMKMSTTFSPSDSLKISFPNFNYQSNEYNWIYISGDETQQYKLTWAETTNILTIVPLLPLARRTFLRLDIDADFGFFTPSSGFPTSKDDVIKLNFYRGDSLYVDQNILNYTIVPSIFSESISFIASDKEYANAIGGNYYVLQIEAEHELTFNDIGSMIVLDGVIYNIANVTDNLLYLEQEYIGPRVFLGEPEISVRTPNHRYAYYHSGSDTSHLIFMYYVNRGDSSQNISLYSNSSTYRIDLDNSKMLRSSQNPEVAISRSIPPITSGSNRIVNTEIPIVESIYTTSPIGMYSIGELIDINIKFSFSVVIDPVNVLPVPRLILSLTSGQEYASYSSGSGTNNLVFLYEIKDFTNQSAFSLSSFQESPPLYDALRFIIGNEMVYLRRKANHPHIEANLELTTFNLEGLQNISINGKAPFVTSMQIVDPDTYSTSNHLNYYYTSGDSIFISLTFNEAISINIGNDNKSMPYIILDTGYGNQSAHATFIGIHLNHSLIFEYVVSNGDYLPSGLKLMCTCIDYLERTFLQSNGSVISSRSTGLKASLLLADNNSLSSLIIDKNLIVNHTVPTVSFISSNSTNGIFGVGDDLILSVVYTLPVYIDGIITLQLVGKNSTSCRASYYSGNGTNIISFLYHISLESSITRLECTDIDSIDITYGNVYRKADRYRIKANNDLPFPRSYNSLSRLNNIIIDNSLASASSLRILASGSSSVILSTNYLRFNSISSILNLKESVEMCGCDISSLLADGQLDAFDVRFNETLSQGLYQWVNQTSDNLISSIYGNYINYTSLILNSNSHLALSYLPSYLVNCFNWWSKYEIADKLILEMSFDRPIALTSFETHIRLNTSTLPIASSAFATDKSINYILETHFLGHPIVDQFFSLRYLGQLTPCMSINIVPFGYFSLFSSLQSLTLLQQHSPSLIVDKVNATYARYNITFSSVLQGEIELLLGNDLNGICSSPAQIGQISLSKDLTRLYFEYPLISSNSIVFKATSNIPSGHYSLSVNGSGLQGMKPFGVQSNSMIMKHFSSTEKLIGESNVFSNSSISILSSILTFNSYVPGSTTNIFFEVCAAESFFAGDELRVYMPKFNQTNPINKVYTTNEVNITWDCTQSTILIYLLQDSKCFKAPINQTVSAIILQLPLTAIYKNDPSFIFSIYSSYFPLMINNPFQTISPVGLSDCSLSFTHLTPGLASNVTLLFTTLLDIEPGNTTIQLYLPRFSYTNKRSLELLIADSPINPYVSINWVNESSSIIINPILVIPAGTYNWTLYPSNQHLQFFVSEHGLTSSNPPTISLGNYSVSSWYLDFSPLERYPIIFGYLRLDLEVYMPNRSYIPEHISFSTLFANKIVGPAKLTIVMPGISSYLGYIETTNLTNGLFESWVWFNHNHSMILSSQSGWNESGFTNFIVNNISSYLYVNSEGIGYKKNNSWAFSISNHHGFTELSPCFFDAPVTRLSQTSLVLKNIETDSFFTGYETMVIEFTTNFPVTFGDIFTINIDNSIVLDFSLAKIRDPCFNISNIFIDINTTSLEITLSNVASCDYQNLYSISWNFSNIYTTSITRPIKQLKSNFARLSWKNIYFHTPDIIFDRIPIIGIYSSEVIIESPFISESSDIILKVLTSSPLQINDMILISLSEFTFQIPASTSIVDQFGRSWLVKYVDTRLAMVVPRNIPSSPLIFKFTGNNSFIVPTNGISYGSNNPNYQITLSRDSNILSSQPIQSISAVGVIEDISMKFHRSISKHGDLEVSLRTLSPLQAFDEIYLTLPLFELDYPVVLPIPSVENYIYDIRSISNKIIKITLWEKMYSNSFSFKVLSTSVLCVSPSPCLTIDDCLLEISIVSNSNPVNRYLTSMNNTQTISGSQLILKPVTSLGLNGTMLSYFNISLNNISSNYLELSFHAVFSQPILSGTSVIFSLSNIISSTNNTNVNFFDAKHLWSIQWNETDSTIRCRALENLSGGFHSIDLLSSQLTLIESIVYDDVLNVPYSIYISSFLSDEGFIDHVASDALRNSVLILSNSYPGQVTSIMCLITSMNEFSIGDLIFIDFSSFTYNNPYLTAQLNNRMDFSWNATEQYILLNITRRASQVSFTLPSSNGITVPLTGLPKVNGSSGVKIGYYSVSNHNYYKVTPFNSAPFIAPIVRYNISFDSPSAGYISPMTLILRSVSQLELKAYDKIQIFLPTFFVSPKRSISSLRYNSSLGNWSITWDQCSEILSLVNLQDFKTEMFKIVINDIYLPFRGVSDQLIESINITSNSTNDGYINFEYGSFERIAYFPVSSFSLSPQTNFASSNFTLTFSYSTNLDINDHLILSLGSGGLLLNGQSCNLFATSNFVDLISNHNLTSINFRVNKLIKREKILNLTLSSCISLSQFGFPPSNSFTGDYTISILKYDNKFNGLTRLDRDQSFNKFGLLAGLIHYDFSSIESLELLKISLSFTSSIQVGDQIAISLPLISSNSNTTLTLKGDQSYYQYKSHFNAIFLGSAQILLLTCTNSLPQRPFTIYIEANANLSFIYPVASQNFTHYISANLSNLGFLDWFPIRYQSNELSPIRSPQWNIQNCFDNQAYCNYQFSFDLLDSISMDSFVAFMHPSLSLAKNASLELIGSSSSFFEIKWRPADDFTYLSLLTKEILVSNENNILVKSGIPTIPISYNLSTLSIPQIPLIFKSDIPRIVRFSVDVKDYVDLICGDQVYIQVEFNRPVVVMDPLVKLFLNTNEFATYFSGSNSKVLTFQYAIWSARPVSSLGVNGPGALEVTSYGRILDAESPNIAANISFFEPFIFSVINPTTGVSSAVSVNCSGTAYITDVYPYSGSNKIYSSGDYLDIAVVYNRPIKVYGSPVLTLSNKDLSFTFEANYLNISSSQYLSMSSIGYFSLVYLNESTGCIMSNDSSAILEALRNINLLKESLPITIQQLTDLKGISYRILFEGLSPRLLQFSSYLCEDRTYGSVSLDYKLRNNVIFRYKVNKSDPVMNVTYPMGSCLNLSLANDHIYLDNILGLNKSAGTALPDPSSKEGLMSKLAVIDNSSPFIVNITSNFSRYYSRSAINGDSIFITLTFSAPLTLIDPENIHLPLNMSNILNNKTDLIMNYPISNYHTAKFVSYNENNNQIVFMYYVLMGDTTFLGYLDVDHLNGSLVLGSRARIYRNSRNNDITANLTLPSLNSGKTLIDSQVSINASYVPTILRVYADPHSNPVSAGTTLYIHIQFSTILKHIPGVNSTTTLSCITPHSSHLTYFNGSETDLWTFSYPIFANYSSGNVSFKFQLLNGYAMDIFNRKITNLTETIYTVEDTIIDTDPPKVLVVNCDCDDGFYYPGQTLMLYVEFDKSVVILNESTPSLELYVPTEILIDALASYHHGNGTKKLYFSYTIPAPSFRYEQQLHFLLDYAGMTALFFNLNNSVIMDASEDPQTLANTMLPSMDRSFLGFQRHIYIHLINSKVIRAYSLNSGILTAGDILSISIEFTTPIMFFNPPPYFLIQMVPQNRTMKYAFGNGTNVLTFEYEIQVGDSTNHLDYVDTRFSPYSSFNLYHSFPLISYDNYEAKIFSSALANLYMLSDIPGFLIPIATVFPLPGETGSLSANQTVTISSSIPQITSVITSAPTGTYGVNILLPILINWDVPVVIYGCPKLRFIYNNQIHDAIYTSGNGTNQLILSYVILPNEYAIEFDYYDRFSLIMTSCPNYESFILDYSIRRLSKNPKIYANLTLPWVKYVETVISPTSISGSGTDLNIVGYGAHPTSIQSTSQSSSSSSPFTYSFGDILTFEITFSDDVAVVQPQAYLRIINPDNNNSLFSNVFYTNMINDTTIQFTYAVGLYDSASYLSYDGIFAFRSISACTLKDIYFNSCASQALPAINSSVEGSYDNISSKNIRLISSLSSETVVSLISIDFSYSSKELSDSLIYGENITIICTFSTEVEVIGNPIIRLYLHNLGVEFHANYDSHQGTIVTFTRPISSLSISGKLVCDINCEIQFIHNFGEGIRRKSSFLSLIDANSFIPNRACQNEECQIFTTSISPEIPRIVRVWSNSTNGVVSFNETVFIVIEFSRSVNVLGSAWLILDLPLFPSATYIGHLTPSSLLFTYRVSGKDYSSALDYVAPNALETQSSISLAYGIFASYSSLQIRANLTLPFRGARGSLARESLVIIDQDRPGLVSIHASPSSSSCGDLVFINLAYSQSMELSKISDDLSSETSDITLELTLFRDTDSQLVTYYASFESLLDNELIFSFQVSSNIPLGTINITNQLPLYLGNYNLISQSSGLVSSPIFLSKIRSSFSLPVKASFPTVLEVSSPNATSSYPYSMGDVIYIYVWMSDPVRVLSNATITLALNNGAIREAVFKRIEINNTRLLFEYIVEADDVTNALEYQDEYSLIGEIFAISNCDVPVAANLALPSPFAIGSLSSNALIQIDTEPPYIFALFPVKVAGTYGANEVILVVARFNKPVVVYGSPYLLLQVGTNSTDGLTPITGMATYSPLANLTDFQDLTVYLSSLDVVFVYMIQESDSIDSLVHAGSDALQLPFNSSILQLSTNPTLLADTTLREPYNFVLENGQVDRQWKYRFPAKVELFLRDFYHSKPKTLSATLQHAGTKSNIFTKCCAGRTFGQTQYNHYTKGTISSAFGIHSQKLGDDYFFSDPTFKNIANKGRASQSTTILSASNAIDGGLSPFIGDGSVTETQEEDNAWWQLTLPTNSTVKSLRIYERKPQQWVTPIVSFTIKGLERNPSGYFKLLFSNIDSSNTSKQILTDFIPIQISAVDLQKVIDSQNGLGNIDVTRKPIVVCKMLNGLCGPGSEKGYGFIYQLDFLSVIVTSPSVEVVSVRYPGQPLVDDELPYEIQKFPIVTSSSLVRQGYYTAIFKEYQNATGSVDLSNTNTWLTPFYVFLFNSSVSSVPENISDCIDKSSWYSSYSAIDTTLVINLPITYNVSFIKIQRQSFGMLSLTEVEVFSESLPTLSNYPAGSPVASYDLNAPYSPEIPFAPIFGDLVYDGRWVVQITQDTLDKAAIGTISEAVLVITDYAGVVYPFYQNLFSQIMTLPRYGNLYTTTSGSTLYYADWQQSFGLQFLSSIDSFVDQRRYMGLCYGDIDGKCQSNLYPDLQATRPQLSQQAFGDVAKPVFLRKERIVYYVPVENFTGTDSFTYQLIDGLSIQNNSQIEVQMMVQPCRQYFNKSDLYFQNISMALCNCAPSMQSIIGNITACESSITNICRSTILRKHFIEICDTCIGYASSSSPFTNSTQCKAQVIRSVSLLRIRGICLTSSVLSANVDAPGVSLMNLTPWSEAYESEICLQPKQHLDKHSFVRTNYIPFQSDWKQRQL